MPDDREHIEKWQNEGRAELLELRAKAKAFDWLIWHVSSTSHFVLNATKEASGKDGLQKYDSLRFYKWELITANGVSLRDAVIELSKQDASSYELSGGTILY